MSSIEIYKEIIEDLTNKLSSYVKSYEEALVNLKIQALEGFEQRDSQISDLQSRLAEIESAVTELQPADVEEASSL
jgi:predicted RNase H-like nuclease (RuvC/YqgF family)